MNLKERRQKEALKKQRKMKKRLDKRRRRNGEPTMKTDSNGNWIAI